MDQLVLQNLNLFHQHQLIQWKSNSWLAVIGVFSKSFLRNYATNPVLRMMGIKMITDPAILLCPAKYLVYTYPNVHLFTFHMATCCGCIMLYLLNTSINLWKGFFMPKFLFLRIYPWYRKKFFGVLYGYLEESQACYILEKLPSEYTEKGSEGRFQSYRVLRLKCDNFNCG